MCDLSSKNSDHKVSNMEEHIHRYDLSGKYAKHRKWHKGGKGWLSKQRRTPREPTVLRSNGMFWLPRWVSLRFDSQEDFVGFPTPICFAVSWRQAKTARVVPDGTSDFRLDSLCWSYKVVTSCQLCKAEPAEWTLTSIPLNWWVEPPWGMGMFEAMRLSTHVLSSPCTITRSEAWCSWNIVGRSTVEQDELAGIGFACLKVLKPQLCFFIAWWVTRVGSEEEIHLQSNVGGRSKRIDGSGMNTICIT